MANLAINGGPMACDVQWPSWPMWDDGERTALLEVLESGKWWYGERVKEFERRFAALHGAGYGITSNSGSTSLEVALLALGIQAGDEVIIPPYTFMATAVSVIRVNAIPVFADVDGDTLCMDPADVARKITPKTKGIIPVHIAGNFADMRRLMELAKAHGLFVLEDACHAWGSRWNGQGAGTIGDCGVFSFQVSKNITAAEGGIVITTNEALAHSCRSYTNCGRFPGKAWYCHENIGTNLRMTEFQAAILLAQLDRFDSQMDQRQASAEILDRGLEGVRGIVKIKQYPGIDRRSYHVYPFRIDPEVLGVSRDRFVEALVAEGVPAAAGYTVPLYKFDFFRHGPVATNRGCQPYLAAGVDYADVCCPVCEKVCDTTVWLKHSLLLAGSEAVEKLVAAVRKVAANAGELGK